MLTDLVLGVLVLGLLIYRQLVARQVSSTGLRIALLDAHRGTAGLGNASIVLYLAITLAVQRAIVSQRARRLDAGGAAPFFGTGPTRV